MRLRSAKYMPEFELERGLAAALPRDRRKELALPESLWMDSMTEGGFTPREWGDFSPGLSRIGDTPGQPPKDSRPRWGQGERSATPLGSFFIPLPYPWCRRCGSTMGENHRPASGSNHPQQGSIDKNLGRAKELQSRVHQLLATFFQKPLDRIRLASTFGLPPRAQAIGKTVIA